MIMVAERKLWKERSFHWQQRK